MKAMAVRLAGLVVITLAAMSSTARSADLKIGIIASLSGQGSGVGRMMAFGARIAIEDLTKSGDLKGHVESITADDSCDPGNVKTKAQQLVQQDGVNLVIGPSCFVPSVAVSDYLKSLNVLQINPVVTEPLLTERASGDPNPLLFRVADRQDRVATVAAVALHNELQNKKVFLVGSSSQRIWLDKFKSQLVGLATSTEVIDATPTQAQPGSVYVLYNPYDHNAPTPSSQLGDIYEVRALDAGFDIPIVKSDLVKQLFNRALSERLIESGVPSQFRPSLGPAINAYAAVEIWAQTVAQIGSADAEKVATEMHSRTFDTIRGPVRFDKGGDLPHPLVIIVRYGNGANPIVQVPNECNEDRCKNCACDVCCPNP